VPLPSFEHHPTRSLFHTWLGAAIPAASRSRSSATFRMVFSAPKTRFIPGSMPGKRSITARTVRPGPGSTRTTVYRRYQDKAELLSAAIETLR
jgi:hypothetical protein